jgi:hypothetical protein
MKLVFEDIMSVDEHDKIIRWLENNDYEFDKDYSYIKYAPDDIWVVVSDLDDYFVVEISGPGKLYHKDKYYNLESIKNIDANYVDYLDDPDIDYSDDELTLDDSDYDEPYDLNTDEYDDDPFGGDRWGDVGGISRRLF